MVLSVLHPSCHTVNQLPIMPFACSDSRYATNMATATNREVGLLGKRRISYVLTMKVAPLQGEATSYKSVQDVPGIAWTDADSQPPGSLSTSPPLRKRGMPAAI